MGQAGQRRDGLDQRDGEGDTASCRGSGVTLGGVMVGFCGMLASNEGRLVQKNE